MSTDSSEGHGEGKESHNDGAEVGERDGVASEAGALLSCISCGFVITGRCNDFTALLIGANLQFVIGALGIIVVGQAFSINSLSRVIIKALENLGSCSTISTAFAVSAVFVYSATSGKGLG